MRAPVASRAGNGYFHNAYFLRVVHSRIRNTTFHASTGHGLKITQQNDTVIENCTVTDNRWQGIWVGQESRGNFGLAIRDTVVLRNHMYGIQLTETRGFEVRRCTIRNNPVFSKGGLLLGGAHDGIVAESVIADNANNLRVDGVSNVTIDGVRGCERAWLYPLCGKQGQFELRNTSCAARPIEACDFPDSPY